ncbi:hypothetical protein GO755_34845 [Spirosoma sp. HMF4905]|uniref:Uncharacterized protein n=1 Tax=Spirosoma arboris TaxID=2682092 RepID=A0A7K1SN78_9BACT|nr:hypothetical protein [Spirosoma arboris]MVM35252.1 hypothetical protein [Spirosoma arboris]
MQIDKQSLISNIIYKSSILRIIGLGLILISFIIFIFFIAYQENEIQYKEEQKKEQYKTIGILLKKNDSLDRVVQREKLTIGNESSRVVDNSKEIIITGNDGSSIIINPKVKPIIDERIHISSFKILPLYLKKGDKVLIQATGKISVGPNIGTSGPEGKNSGGLFDFPLSQYNIVKEFPHATLMFRYANDTSWIDCGKEYNFTAEKSGFLEFEVNDLEKSNNEGAYQVEIKVYR